MTIHFIMRLILAIILSMAGWQVAKSLISLSSRTDLANERTYLIIAAIAGAAIGYLSAPLLLSKPIHALRRWLQNLPARTLFFGITGATVGLIVAALLSAPLSMLPEPWGKFMPIVSALALGALGSSMMVTRGKDVLAMLGMSPTHELYEHSRHVLLLDTSVIIDGRIADIAKTGFVRGTLLVPRFVLDELQHIADSQDALRRNRGRRGLEILNRLQKDEGLSIEISEHTVPEVHEVDGKLTCLAQELDCPIVTNDYNLNRVAELQGIQVLNINGLANAVKSVLLPGESLQVQIIQEGREAGQGVGYLDDGTMVVVEDGRRHIDATVHVTVTRVLQTVAGRMIFGQIQNGRHA